MRTALASEALEVSTLRETEGTLLSSVLRAWSGGLVLTTGCVAGRVFEGIEPVFPTDGPLPDLPLVGRFPAFPGFVLESTFPPLPEFVLFLESILPFAAGVELPFLVSGGRVEGVDGVLTGSGCRAGGVVGVLTGAGAGSGFLTGAGVGSGLLTGTGSGLLTGAGAGSDLLIGAGGGSERLVDGAE